MNGRVHISDGMSFVSTNGNVLKAVGFETNSDPKAVAEKIMVFSALDSKPTLAFVQWNDD